MRPKISFGRDGHYDYKGRGRKKLFNQEQQKQLKDWTKESPKQLNLVQHKAEQEWGIKASKDTIKRVLKSSSMTWHRIRKVLGGKPYEEEFALKTEQLEDLKKQDQQGKIDLIYLDEVGFSLTPCVPYCLQEKGEKVTIKSERSKRLNVMGFFNTKNKYI